MKCKIMKLVPRDKVEAHVPSAFRGQLQGKDFGTEPVTMLLFPHDRRDVIHSRQVIKALAKVGDTPGAIIALAGSFTHESAQALSARGAWKFALSDFPWTDAGHEHIRILGGAAVKRPSGRSGP
jgi:hypothetical protein